ncbi:MAG: radical SAM protein [Candidatus Aenigmatarchaeota archaeon]
MRFEDVPQLEMLSRIYSWVVEGKKQPPFKLILTPTDTCNLNCFFCPNSTARKSNRLKESEALCKEEWLRVVKEAIKMGVHDFVILGGGEPFLKKDIVMEIFRLVKGEYSRAYFEVITNGTLLNDEDIIEIVDKEMSTLTVSVHSITEKIYEKITGSKKEFKKVIENLKKIKKTKEKLNKFMPIVQINVVVNSLNYKEVPKMIEFFGKLGCEYLSFHYMRCYEDIKSIAGEFELTEKEIEDLKLQLETLSKLGEEKGIIIRTQPLEGKLRINKEEPIILRLRCYEPWYSMSIQPDGSVSRCSAFFTRKETINIHNASLENIWYSDFLEKVRKNVVRGIMMEGCSECGLFSSTSYIKSLFPLYLNFRKGEVNITQIKNILRRK